jgi:uncharacterized membrane protein
MQKHGRQLSRVALKYIHTTAASAWIGGGLAVLVLLRIGRQTGNSDELLALNGAVASIDDFLITPSAAATFVSGLIGWLMSNGAVLRQRWIIAKLLLTSGAIVFGILWLGPWLKELSLIASADRLAVFDDWHYFRTYRLGAVAVILQTALLFVIVLISILKPSFEIQRKGGRGRVGSLNPAVATRR